MGKEPLPLHAQAPIRQKNASSKIATPVFAIDLFYAAALLSVPVRECLNLSFFAGTREDMAEFAGRNIEKASQNQV